MSARRSTVLCALAALVQLGTAAACATDGATSARDARRLPPTDEPFRTQQPKAAPAPELVLPIFQAGELKNGLKIVVVEDHALPFLQMRLLIRAGAAEVAAREAGLAALTYDLVDEAAGTYNALAFADELADLGASLQTSAEFDSGSFTIAVLKKHADRALELVSLAAQRPTFANDDFERVKQQLVAAQRQDEGEADTIARAAVATTTFGPEHPYGHLPTGTLATVEKLTLRQAKKLWGDTFGPKNAALIFAGDVTLDEAKTLAERHFGKWRGRAKPGVGPTPPRVKTGLKVFVVDFKGSVRAAVRVARPMIAAGDGNEPAAIVLNQIVGGAFRSRLNMKLREEKQWTYGAFSLFEARLGVGPFVAGADVQTPDAVAALVETLAQIEQLRASGATDDEVAQAKAGYIEARLRELGMRAARVLAASQIEGFGLPLTHFTDLAKAVEAVTPADVAKLAATTLRRDELVAVVVGDRAAIEPKLKEAGLDNVAFLNRDGSPQK